MSDPSHRRPAGTPGVPAPEPPTAAFFVAFLGGVLIIVEGLALLAGGSEPLSILPAVSSSALPPLGGIGVAAGIGVVAVGFSLQENLRHRVGVGIAAIALGALALASGGGFVVGSVLAIAGGLVAIFREPVPLYAEAGRHEHRARSPPAPSSRRP